MATGEITLQAIKGFKTTDRTEFLWDTEQAGFGLRLTTNGALSYIFQYRMGGREAPKKRVTIGKHGSPWTPKTARDEAKRLALLVGKKIDPVAADKERRRQAVELAFESYVGTFVDGYLKKNWTDWKQVERLLVREAVPVLERTPLPLIKRNDVAAVLRKLSDRPAVAKLMHALLRKMFRWAVDEGDIERSPIENMKAPTGPEARDRVLDDDELTTIWKATAGLGFPFGPMFRVLIATGQRREEVTGLSWGELDQASSTWTLPADRAKNGSAHIVPLNALAIAEIDALAKLVTDPKGTSTDPLTWPKRGFVFSTTGKTVVSGHSRGKARLDRDIAVALTRQAEKDDTSYHPVPGWRVHDIRRTVATGLQRLGVRFEVTEAVLNHISGARSGVAGVYQRHDWKAEKRTALDAWGRHVDALLNPGSTDNIRKIERRAPA